MEPEPEPATPRCVVVLAPSGGAAALFPALTEQGVRRLRELLGLQVRLLPTASLSGEALTPEARAADLNAAFGDSSVAVIVCTIGGDDCVRVLPHLDAELIRAHPKPLLGYSDITSLHLYLYNLGHVSLYGPALLTQFAISGPGMHVYTAESVRAAVLQPERPFEVQASAQFQDGYLPWGDDANLPLAKELEPNPGWDWVGWERAAAVEGCLWGGCLEVLMCNLAARKYLPPGDSLAESLRGSVLFVETSEEFPSEYFVYSFFQSLGELGVLTAAAALLVGRPQTVCRGVSPSCGRDEYRTSQRAAVLRAVAEYCRAEHPLPVIFGLDFGHTDPQVVVCVPSAACLRRLRRA